MPNWRTVDETDLAATISQIEIDTCRASGSPDGADPVSHLLKRTVSTVRGYISCNGSVKMGPDGTLPEGLISAAMDYLAADILKRIDSPLGEDRRNARERAERLFEKVATGQITPESYIDGGEADDGSRPASSPLAAEPTPQRLLD